MQKSEKFSRLVQPIFAVLPYFFENFCQKFCQKLEQNEMATTVILPTIISIKYTYCIQLMKKYVFWSNQFTFPRNKVKPPSTAIAPTRKALDANVEAPIHADRQ